MVMLGCVLITLTPAETTYSESESVKTITATSTEEWGTDPHLVATTTEREIAPAPTAGTTKQVSKVGGPRLVAQRGESQEVIGAIVSKFPEAPIMVEVARCESSLNPAADRVTSDGRTGVDGGLFQINQVHLPSLAELGLDRYDLHDNLEYSRILYDRSGLGPWFMSEHCWGKYS